MDEKAEQPPSKKSRSPRKKKHQKPQADLCPAGEYFQDVSSHFDNGNGKRHWKWRTWHEREVPVKIIGKATKKGVSIQITSKPLTTSLSINYPNAIWENYPKENKVKLVDNITYIFTAHLPFLLKENIRMEYNTGYPHSYSWANQCFMRFLPAYWFLYRGQRGTKVFPLLKTILNSGAYFSETKDVPPRFPETIDENIILPFTFGKDSFLSYNVCKELGLRPTLVYFNEPTEQYAKQHKLELIKNFSKLTGEKIYFLDNPIASLRAHGEGWFGWESNQTSYELLSLPFAYTQKAGYVVFSNEKSVNAFFYDEEGMKVIPDYDQSAQATEEMSLLTQALSEGEVYATTFLQGLNDLAIVGILKDRYYDKTFRFLMSCWADHEGAKNKRWCAECTKCARLYVYLSANGINPMKEAYFKDNMFDLSMEHLYNVFGKKASGTGWDAFGLNTDEQTLAFYICYLRGNRDPLVKKFRTMPAFKEARTRFRELVGEYFTLHDEHITPPQWKRKIDRMYNESLSHVRQELFALYKKNSR